MDENQRSGDPDEYVKSGKGRKDEVGHTGVYPASMAADAPPDAEPMGQEELGHRSPNEALAIPEDVQLAEPRKPNNEGKP